MAKQRGVVQLSGRVDNLCYYQQKRVRGGLVRRINLAMSERVKAGDEYLGLRVANTYFGGCSMLAAGLLSLINQRLLYMTRSDRQSYLTTALYRIFKSAGGSSNDTEINLSNMNYEYIASAFNSLMKVRAQDFFISLPLSKTEVPIGANMVFEIPVIELERYLDFFQGEEVRVNFYYKCKVTDIYRSGDPLKFSAPVVESTINRRSVTWRYGDPDVELIVTAGTDDLSYNCCIFVFDVVKRYINDRPQVLYSSGTAHMCAIEFS